MQEGSEVVPVLTKAAFVSSFPSFLCRRGSNVSLVLDMSALGAVEPLNVAVVTPREAAAREYLLSAGRPLTRQQLRDIVNNTHKLHAEFAVRTSNPPHRALMCFYSRLRDVPMLSHCGNADVPGL